MYYARYLLLFIALLLNLSAQGLNYSVEPLVPKPTFKKITSLTKLLDNSVIAALRPRGMLKSTDEGITWEEVTVTPSFNEVAKVVTFSVNRWYGITSFGEFFYTLNGGSSFTTQVLRSTPPAFTGTWVSFADSLRGAAMFSNLSNSHFIFLTNDGGLNWSQATTPIDYSSGDLLRLSDSIIVLSCSNKLLRSSNLGTTWKTVLYGRGGEFYNPGNGKVFMFGGLDTIFSSSDNGLTWQFASKPEYALSAKNIIKLNDSSFYTTDKYMHTIYKSNNELITWNHVAFLGNIVGYGMGKTFLMYSDTVGIFAGDNGGICRYAGTQLVKSDISKLHFYPSSTFFSDSLLGINTFCYSTEDGGRSWVAGNISSTSFDRGSPILLTKAGLGFIGFNRVFQIVPDPNYTNYTDLYVSSDNGSTWSKREIIKYFGTPTATMLGDSLVYAVLQRLQSTGTQWQSRIIQFKNGQIDYKTMPLSISISSLASINWKKMIIAVSGSYVVASYDTALTWDTLFYAVNSETLNSIFANEKGLITAIGRDNIYTTSDYGANWVKGYPPMSYPGSWAMNSNGLIAYAYDNFIRIGYKNWSSWQVLNFDLVDEVRNLQFVDEKTLMVQTKVGAYFKYIINDTTTSISEIDPTIPISLKLAQNFPNPFNPETVIRFQLPVAGYVKGVVYDILGREVATLINGEMPAGYHEIKFDSKGIASGVYIFRIESGKFSSAIKMVVGK